MRYLLTVLIVASVTTFVSAQSETDRDLVRRAALNYIEGFYEGDSLKLKESLMPSLYKFGYWRNDETGDFGDEIHMNFRGAINFARQVKERGTHPADDAPRGVEILDLMSKIAAVKVTAWWGVDYMLLAKQDNKWMISHVIWQGPLKE